MFLLNLLKNAESNAEVSVSGHGLHPFSLDHLSMSRMTVFASYSDP